MYPSEDFLQRIIFSYFYPKDFREFRSCGCDGQQLQTSSVLPAKIRTQIRARDPGLLQEHDQELVSGGFRVPGL